MEWKSQNEVEEKILDSFSKKLEECDDVSEPLESVLRESLTETTLSNASQARELAQQVIEEKEDGAD